MLSESAIVSHLKQILYPGSRRDIVALGLIRHVRVEEGKVLLHLRPSSASEEVLRLLTGKISALLEGVPEIKHVEIHGGARHEDATLHTLDWLQATCLFS